MTQSDDDRTHADLLLAKKRTEADLKAARAALGDMAQQVRGAWSDTDNLVVSRNRLRTRRKRYDQPPGTLSPPLPTDDEVKKAVSRRTELQEKLNGINSELARFEP